MWSLMKRLIWLRVISGGGVLTTVTGASPLALANALSKSIRSLIQYGKVTTSNGDTYCNNGKLVAVDDELPSGYTRITGIKFDGDFYYDTGEVLNGDDVVTMTLANTASSGQNVFGSYNGTSSGTKNFSLFIYGGGSSSNSYFRYGEQLLRPKFGSNEHTITLGGNGTTGFATDVTATPETFTTTATAYIGMLPNSSSAAYTGSIIGEITVGTRLKWIPCERVNDGVIGYYEAIGGTFLEPVGTGTPVAGSYDTSHLTVLTVEGTPEVLTVVGKNLLDTTGISGVSAGVTYTRNEDGSITCTGESSNNNTAKGINFTKTIPNGTYVLSGGTSIIGVRLNTYGANGLIQRYTAKGSPVTVSVTDEVTSFNLSVGYITSGTTVDDTVYPQLELGSTATEYEQYAPQTATVVNLFSDGTVYDEQDIISGTVTRRTAVSVSGGVITISALPSPVTEHVTPQSMQTAEGNNAVAVTSAVDPVQLSATYTASE